ncbi:hypothetical protein TNCV_461421 [Trichonephila clavipes]|nr:hypothetical protein TNCV_461421 [Trichonephila clavipes]
MIGQINRSKCCRKPSNCDADLSFLEIMNRQGWIASTRDGRRMVHMAGMDRAAALRTIAQRIQSVQHFSVDARTIRRRMQWNDCRRPLIRLPLTGNDKHSLR